MVYPFVVSGISHFTAHQKTARITLLILGAWVLLSFPVLASETSPHWTYGGETNPTQWGRLSHDFALCDVGHDQSPIDINHVILGSPAAIEFNYAPTPLTVVNTGHTIQVNYEAGSHVTMDGEIYELVQFHFHTPSEHTTDGQAAAMELHLVHQNSAGELAVVGILINIGVENPAIAPIWDHIPAPGETHTVEGLTINAADFLPDNTSYYSYAGSLTTPPCSEGVRWNVLAEPIELSEEQVAAFAALYPVNARPVQPTNGRVIELHAAE